MSDEASPPPCPNCAKLEKRVVELEARVAELLQRLDSNSSNSSKPPSSDPPSAGPRPGRPSSGRKAGGQSGHSGHSRTLKPVEEVDRLVEAKPPTCEQCGSLLLGDDPQRSGIR